MTDEAMTDGETAERRAGLATALAALEGRLAAACSAAGRPRTDVRLVAVTKTHPASDVLALVGLGVRDLGENRDQEASAKAAAVARLLGGASLGASTPGPRWHFVGALQTNKAASVASYAALVHSVDRAALVGALSKGAVRAGRTLEVLLQVSLDGDPARGGALPADLPALADLAAGALGLRLAGVMAVAPLNAPPERAFAELAALAAQVRASHPEAVEISAGMSGDLEAAVAAGATYVRVGTALLGVRAPLSR